MQTEWVFLDFDGVLCDSLEECFQTSGLLVDKLGEGRESFFQQPPRIDLGKEYETRFRAGRSYIRSGEDYVVLHRLLREGKDPRSQKDFDAALKAEGEDRLLDYKNRLYRFREILLNSYAATWLSWNPLYPGIADALHSLLSDTRVWILSTKKEAFIAAILHHHGVDWPSSRILYTSGQSKLSLVETTTGFDPSVLVDDQIDHLDFRHRTCSCRLALWGYASPEAKASGVPAWTLDEALAYLKKRSI